MLEIAIVEVPLHRIPVCGVMVGYSLLVLPVPGVDVGLDIISDGYGVVISEPFFPNISEATYDHDIRALGYNTSPTMDRIL